MNNNSVENEVRYWNALRGGDRSALAWLYEHYLKLLYNYGRKMGVENDALEDALHDLFVDLWRFRQNLSPIISVRFYLYRSLRRKVLRNGTRKKYFTHQGLIIEDTLEMMAPSFEHDMVEAEISDERVHLMKKLLNDLSPRQYEALVLRFYDDLSFEEIASILDMNEQSARNLVQRGLLQLKQYAKHVISLAFICLLF
jgi:RNA polymerase sigma factor (sigma-70 family)